MISLHTHKTKSLILVTFFSVLFWTPSLSWAATVENVSDQAIVVTRWGETVSIPPHGLEFIPDVTMSEPWFRQMLRSKQLVIVKDPKKQITPKLTEAYCRSDDYPDDASYCWMDLAEQEAAPMYCAMGLDSWSGIKECLYYVDRQRKLTPNDCNVFDPGSPERKNCLEYVKSGIPSKPGRSYEDSLK